MVHNNEDYMTIEITDDTFEQEVLKSDIPVIVDFWAPWCGPCKSLAPTFDSLSSEYEGKVKFTKANIDETELAQKYGVRSIPTLIIFKNGEVVGTKSGAQPKAALAAFVDSSL